eukprot:TRINITY_DN9148_c1_g2_i1.p1 TRINITY_DN9148_c1_g2~~TRINITY_DN9148_c1_g2_i1.p1  ORF type:complete len:268 (+),score=38.45 TRINITY_DN9148_c1_g2_i1:202-1005(+)
MTSSKGRLIVFGKLSPRAASDRYTRYRFLLALQQHADVWLVQGITAPLIGSMAENAVLFSSYKTATTIMNDKGIADGSFRSAMAGMSAGVAVSFVLTPVELVKCKLQIQTVEGQPKLYNGTWDCIRKTLRNEGGLFGGLYRGHSATLLREMPGNVAWYAFYDAICRLFVPEGKTKDDVAPWKFALAGGLSGMAYWTAGFPADTVKSQMQTNPKLQGVGFLTVLRNIVAKQGVAGLYRGWLVTVSRALPSNAVLFMTYETVERLLRTS